MIANIYYIESPTGAIYVGQTRNFKKRIQTYKGLRCKDQTKIYHSLKKYGFEAHTVGYLQHFSENVSQEILDWYEMEYIKLFRKEGFVCLNIANGGGAPMHGRKHSEETRIKMRINNSGPRNPNYGKGCLGPSNGRARAIYQYDMNGNLIREWDTVTNASKETGINRLTISANLRGQLKSAKGFIWKYKL